MSDSRLEKFIYAICSMDVSDLPVPLSRIETLWNCLITGETPDFEPLSRNEKYLMAMLDRYDISNLPAPMSRGEKLLYKIAVGETDLSDVPGYLSRYEELLKYLIENGGISGGDFEYVLYTLNQSLHTLYLTAEKPVKSAILKGQTLVNLARFKTKWGTATVDGSVYGLQTKEGGVRFDDLLKPSTQYTVIIDFLDVPNDELVSLPLKITMGNNSFNYINITSDELKNGRVIKQQTTYSTFDSNVMVALRQDFSSYLKFKIMIIEGDHTNNEIPFFDGMKSVQMPVLTTTGKNLFDKTKIIFDKLIDYHTGIISDDAATNVTDFIKVLPNTQYTMSFNFATNAWTRCLGLTEPKHGKYVTDANGISDKAYFDTGSKTYTFTTSPTTNYLIFSFGKGVEESFQLEQGSTATTYEPYKLIILDRMPVLTTTGKNLFDGELENGAIISSTGVNTPSTDNVRSVGYIKVNPNASIVLSNDLNYSNNIIYEYDSNKDFIGRKETNPFTTSTNCQYIRFRSNSNQSNLDVKYQIEYGTQPTTYEPFKSNILTVNEDVTLRSNSGVYDELNLLTGLLTQRIGEDGVVLSQEVIKTVDLSVVDQDNQPTELGTFENITHVSLEAENLIPEVEMEVATNLLENTVFNLTNAFNTLYPTAAKPVKSAILKGNTIINLVNNFTFGTGATQTDDYFTLTQTNSRENIKVNIETSLIELNKDYTLIYFIQEKTTADPTSLVIKQASYFAPSGNAPLTQNIGWNKIKFNLSSYGKTLGLNIAISSTEEDGNYIKFAKNKFALLAGDWTQKELPFDTTNYGIQSVKMPVLTTTGKNLFDGELENGAIISSTGVNTPSADNVRSVGYIKVNPNASIVLSNDLNYSNNIIYEYDSNKDYIGRKTTNPFTTSTNCHYIRFRSDANQSNLDVKYQIEYGTIATPYEPFKSNILTVNEDVELRGIGDVQDELDLLTGEVAQNIGEFVVNGTENWKFSAPLSDTTAMFSLGNAFNSLIRYPEGFITDSAYPKRDVFGSERDFEGIELSTNNPRTIYMKVKKSSLNGWDETLSPVQKADLFKSLLSQNPITFQYQLAQESIKTVDLTTVNQDGNVTTLNTFDDTTHVLLNSEGLIPTAVLTVRTKIPSASSTSLLMDDISTEQQQLEATVDEQSENVDATMIATTEIFEETL